MREQKKRTRGSPRVLGTVYECPKGDPRHRITLYIPQYGIVCPHGVMKRVVAA